MKKSASCLLGLMLAGSAVAAAGGGFSVETAADGTFRILHEGSVLVERVSTQGPGTEDAAARKVSALTMPDGSKVWNVWNETPDRTFRTEIALAPDAGSVEINYAAYSRGYAPEVKAGRTLELSVPLERFAGGDYAGFVGRATQDKKASGKLAEAADKVSLGGNSWRFLVLKNADGKSFSFDLNPIGAGDFISIYKDGAARGVWPVRKEGNRLRFIGGTSFREYGGYIGAKVRIRTGGMENYRQDHALEKFSYGQSMAAERLLSFGAVLKGTAYTSGNLAKYGEKGPWGWSGVENLALKASRKPGAYYSNVTGKDGVFRFGELPKGLYLLTAGIGNFQNLANHFGIQCNGVTLAENLTVGDREAVIVTLPVWLENGTAEVKFPGDFLLSTLGLQRLIASAEDFSFRRGYWVSDGFEPAPMFRNQDYRDALTLKPFMERFPMPEPGKEASGERRQAKLEWATLRADDPGAMWRYSVNIGNCLSNSSTLAELDDPRSMAEFWRRTEAEKRNAIITSGLHSRHTYSAHLERGQRAMMAIAAEAHKRNVKVIDHHDVTLLWNLDRGFRTVAERLPEVTRSLRTELPGYQFCIMNPVFRKTYIDYLLREVQGGVDGFMCDEIQFFEDCCACAHCRAAFRRDTGWDLPLNETDRFFAKEMTPLKQAYYRWRKEQVGNFWVEMRKAIDKINPSVTLLVYTTHYGFVDKWAPLTQGTDLFENARGADFFGTEMMSRNIIRSARAVPAYRKAKNLLRVGFGTPIWGLVTTQPDYNGQYFGWAICNMNGQAPWLGAVSKPVGETAYLNFDPMQGMNRARAVPEAKIALLYSNNARDYSPNGGMRGELFGTAQTLESMHASYEIIGPMSLVPRTLQKYKVLIVAGTGCLSDQEVKTIKEFVQEGGTVLLTDNSGAFDENGHPVMPWRFDDVFGKDSPSDVAFGPELVDEKGKVIPNQVGLRRVAYPGGAHELLTEKAFGKGRFYRLNYSLASALCASEGTPGRVWDFTLDATLDRLYRTVLEKVTAPGRVWSVDAPDLVLTTLYRDGDALVAHFLNATACSNTVGQPMSATVPDPAFPELAREVSFTVPGRWQSAEAVSPDFAGRQKLSVRYENGQSSVTLPKQLFHAYTIVILHP